MKSSIRVVCAHDCPDMCSLIAHVEDGKIVRVQGDPDHPYTAGFACGKVNRDADLVNSPERIKTPLRRTGPKGVGPVHADHLGPGARRDHGQVEGDHRRERPARPAGLRLLRPSGPDEPRPGERPVPCARRLAPAWPARCATRAARRRGNCTVGPIGGADPEDVVHSDLVISWGADLAATNVHFWALAEEQRKKRGVPIVVIDPRRTRSAKAADLYLPIRIGTDAALALGIMHILVRDKLADRDYIAKHTLGFDKVEREILPKFAPAARRRDHRPRRRRHREARGDVRQGQGRDDPARRRHDATRRMAARRCAPWRCCRA